MRVAWVAVLVLLLAGCSSPAPKSEDAQTPVTDTAASTLAVEAVPLRFASGDYESISTYQATFQQTDGCLPECSGTAQQVIDLTPVIPAEAPVELSLTLTNADGINANLVYVDADPVQVSDEDDGQNGGGGGGGGGRQVNALLSRSPSGTVGLQLTHQVGRFSIDGGAPGGPIVVDVEARVVVRADTLVSGMPASVVLPAGAVVNFTSDDLDQALLITPNGAIQRDVDSPFQLTVPNGTVGASILMVTGDSTKVVGPNVTMSARRVTYTETAPKDVATGKTTLDLTAEKAPLLVGVYVEPKEAVAFVSAAPFMGPYTVTITAPGNVGVLSEDCSGGGNGAFPICEFGFFGGGGSYSTAFLDEHLSAGSYTIEIEAQQANSFQAVAYQLQIS